MGVLDLMGYVQKQGAMGQEEGKRNRLADLAGQAYGAAPDQQRGYVQQAIATDPAQGMALGKSLEGDNDRAMEGLARRAKILVAASKSGNSQMASQMYPQLAAEAQRMGYPVPGEWSDEFVPGLEQMASAWGDDAASGTGVQSTYIDAQGNRVAIMRDGSTQVLGQNAANNQIIDTGANGFFGVNKGNLSAAPVTIGGPPQAAPQRGPGEVPYSIDPSLPPQVQAAIRADEARFANAPEGANIPIGSQQASMPSGQLYSAPKPTAPVATFAPLTSDEIAQMGLPPGTVAQRNLETQQVSVVSKPPSASSTNPTEGERKSATLLQRMEGSLSQLTDALQSDPSAAAPTMAASVAGSLPFVGDLARNKVNSSERQRVEAAQLDILDAALTLGTGAAYTREQLEGYRKAYFPQLGDSESTIADKEARLKNVIEAGRIAAGRAAPQQPGQPTPPPPRANVTRIKL